MPQDSRLELIPQFVHSQIDRPRWLLTGLWISIVIAVAVVIRRLVAL